MALPPAKVEKVPPVDSTYRSEVKS